MAARASAKRRRRRLYAEAGYSAEKPLRTEIMYNTQEDHRRIAVAIATMWKRVLGVEATISNQEWKVFLDTPQPEGRRRRCFRSSWIGDYNDAFTFAEILHSTRGRTIMVTTTPSTTVCSTRRKPSTISTPRARLLEQAERVMLADMPIIPLYFYVSKHMVKPWVGGRQSNIMDHHFHKRFFVLEH